MKAAADAAAAAAAAVEAELPREAVAMEIPSGQPVRARAPAPAADGPESAWGEQPSERPPNRGAAAAAAAAAAAGGRSHRRRTAPSLPSILPSISSPAACVSSALTGDPSQSACTPPPQPSISPLMGHVEPVGKRRERRRWAKPANEALVLPQTGGTPIASGGTARERPIFEGGEEAGEVHASDGTSGSSGSSPRDDDRASFSSGHTEYRGGRP